MHKFVRFIYYHYVYCCVAS